MEIINISARQCGKKTAWRNEIKQLLKNKQRVAICLSAKSIEKLLGFEPSVCGILYFHIPIEEIRNAPAETSEDDSQNNK